MKPFKLPARLWQTLLLVLTAAAFSPLSVFAAEAGEEAYTPSVYATAWALLPPIIAIGLALITKEVYSSLFLGIVMGGLLYSGFSFEGTTMHVLEDGFISVLSDSYNVGIHQQLIAEMTRRGFVYFDWNVANGDAVFSKIQPSSTLTANALKGVGTARRAIILMHDSSAKTTTVEALPAIIEGYLEAGYSFAALTPSTRSVTFSYLD